VSKFQEVADIAYRLLIEKRRAKEAIHAMTYRLTPPDWQEFFATVDFNSGVVDYPTDPYSIKLFGFFTVKPVCICPPGAEQTCHRSDCGRKDR